MSTPNFQPGDRAICIMRNGERELTFGQTYYVFDVLDTNPQRIVIDDNVLREGMGVDILLIQQPQTRSWPSYRFQRVVALCDQKLK